MSAAVKPWLILAVIFIAGGFTGSALTMVFSGQLMHAGGPPADMRQSWMLRLTRQLNLTPDQQTKIEPILRDTADKVQKIHGEEFGKVRDILKASDAQIAAILTPDQQAALKQMEADREKAFSRHQHQWGGGPDGGRFHGGGYPPSPPPATNAPGH